MSEVMIITIIGVGFLFMLLAGMYIHSVLLAAGIGGLILLDGFDLLPGLVGAQPFGRSASYTLTTIPLFILMAQFILQAGIVKDIFHIVNRVARGRRGVLGTLTLVAGALLGAVSGSGTATAASLGQVAVPELRKHGFSPPLAGAMAASAGSMSGIIPPSIILILYGVATETSVGALFIGAVVPGIMVTVVFIGIMVWYLRRSAAEWEEKSVTPQLPDDVGARQIITSVVLSLAVGAVVFGGIYSGMVTPTEAGAIGAFAGLLAALVLGKVNIGFLRSSLMETVKVTVMVMLILIGAQVFGRFVSLSLIPRRLIGVLEPVVERPFLMLMILAALFFVLFMFIEGAAVILMSIPVVLPIVQAMETNVLWFGVFVGVICTVGLITPPVGLSVYAVSGTTGISSDAIFRYTTVFAAAAALIVCGLMIIFPELALWLPTRGG